MANEDLNTVILFLIEQTSKIAKQSSQREFDHLKIGITVDQWVLLKIIEQQIELSQNELAVKSHRDPASITRSLDILQQKKLIIREQIADNRRQYIVRLTKEGRSFILQHMPLIADMRAKSLKGFTKTETELLKSLLLRIQDNYR
jgi:MarR family transcriptional regulator, transcriptional regulator for hemolysin